MLNIKLLDLLPLCKPRLKHTVLLRLLLITERTILNYIVSKLFVIFTVYSVFCYIVSFVL